MRRACSREPYSGAGLTLLRQETFKRLCRLNPCLVVLPVVNSNSSSPMFSSAYRRTWSSVAASVVLSVAFVLMSRVESAFVLLRITYHGDIT